MGRRSPVEVATVVVALTLVVAGCSGSSSTSIESTTQPTATPVTTIAVPTTADPEAGTAVTELVIRERSDGLDPQPGILFQPPFTDWTAPVVVLLHGAGQSPLAMEELALKMADGGAIVLSAGTLVSEADPGLMGPASGDAVCAVAYARANSDQWGASPGGVIVVGHSAGGHVGLLAALAPETFEHWCPTAAGTEVMGYVGLATNPGGAAEGEFLTAFYADDPQLLAQINTFTHFGANPDLVIRFVQGEGDPFSPLEGITAFHDALVEAGYDSQLIVTSANSHSHPIQPDTPTGQAAVDAIAELLRLATNS